MDYLKELIERYPNLSVCKTSIYDAYKILVSVYEARGKLLIAGNGGSAADAGHIAGELMKSFVKKRNTPPSFYNALCGITNAETAGFLSAKLQRGLPAIDLSNHNPVITAVINDIGAETMYAQQVYSYAHENDAFIGISTSGNSENVYLAMLTAKALAVKTIALTGSSGGKLAKTADVSIKVPETETYKIQELHLPVYHCICLMLEEYFFE
ncbi:MAG: SIS domain-containing protein [Spirochaetaceae bacterium]|jgi:D-sedoheptulose 7-phosphate isomerase|nr:SIS domain-containing protein [Spirochaetaceae bacterium]